MFVRVLINAGFACEYFVIKIRFHDEMLALRPTPKLEDHQLSAVCDWLFNTFAVALHIGDRSPTRNLMTRHIVMTGSWENLWGRDHWRDQA
jgi:hypothetical protein